MQSLSNQSKTATPRKVAARVLAIGLVAAMAAGAASAGAPQSDDAPSVVVKYDARNLVEPNGIEALYRRLVRATNQVCPQRFDRDLRLAAQAQRCRAESLARAIQAVNNPRLAALYAEATKRG